MRAPPPLTLILLSATMALAWFASSRETDIHVPDAVPSAQAAVAANDEAAEKPIARYVRRGRPDLYYRAIDDRPLFSPTRRPHGFAVEELEAEIAVKTDPEPEIRDAPIRAPEVVLKGVMFSESHKSALLSIEGAAADWIDNGALIDDWRLNISSPAEIVLELGEESVRVGLYEN